MESVWIARVGDGILEVCATKKSAMKHLREQTTAYKNIAVFINLPDYVSYSGTGDLKFSVAKFTVKK